MARTAAMGLRRDPQPPMPMVIPLRNSPTSSSSDSRLSAMVPDSVRSVGGVMATVGGVGVALLDEGGPLLVGHAGHMELVGEALLEAGSCVFTSTGSMPLRDSLARRMMVGLLAAMSPATS